MNETVNMNATVKLTPEERQEIRSKTAKPLLWLGIIGIIMLFAGLTSAYVVSMGSNKWVSVELPQIFWISSAVILLSSLTMNWALQSAKKNERTRISTALMLTFVLGLGFCVSQYLGWSDLYSRSIVFAGKYSHPAGSYLYFLTALHLLHLLAGMIALLVTWRNAAKGRYDSQHTLGLELCALYWHFLDFLWIYLFFFLYFIR
ncbi:MAG: cytochrome c oxidase subunit 3 [Bacteroidota bacterium]